MNVMRLQVIVFGSSPQPAYMPCDECGASLLVRTSDEHVCSEQRQLEYRLFQLRAELGMFDHQVAAYLESPHGRFELWYAVRERRLKGPAAPE
jgi:hypothetical protein